MYYTKSIGISTPNVTLAVPIQQDSWGLRLVQTESEAAINKSAVR